MYTIPKGLDDGMFSYFETLSHSVTNREGMSHRHLCCLCYLLCDDYICFFVASYEIFLANCTLLSIAVRTIFWGGSNRE